MCRIAKRVRNVAFISSLRTPGSPTSSDFDGPTRWKLLKKACWFKMQFLPKDRLSQESFQTNLTGTFDRSDYMLTWICWGITNTVLANRRKVVNSLKSSIRYRSQLRCKTTKYSEANKQTFTNTTCENRKYDQCPKTNRKYSGKSKTNFQTNKS